MGSVCSKRRVFVQTSSGRKGVLPKANNRYSNVLGTINPLNQKLITVTNDTYINSESVCELLRKIRQAHPDRNIPVKLVLDNAAYQRAKLVESEAERLGIKLVFLPSYSPHFNLIERLWKFVKKTCLYSRYHTNFDRYKASIMDCLGNTNKKYKAKIKTLLNPKFQSFNKVHIISG